MKKRRMERIIKIEIGKKYSNMELEQFGYKYLFFSKAGGNAYYNKRKKILIISKPDSRKIISIYKDYKI